MWKVEDFLKGEKPLTDKDLHCFPDQVIEPNFLMVGCLFEG